jgi:hypothetical protein
MLGMGSAMLIANKALPDANNIADATMVTSEAAQELASELKFAITFTVRDANTVEFIVSDRNGDEVPETIRYA